MLNMTASIYCKSLSYYWDKSITVSPVGLEKSYTPNVFQSNNNVFLWVFRIIDNSEAGNAIDNGSTGKHS